MLPLFRVIPVGGVLLAVAILLLALHPPRGTVSALAPDLLAARGPLIERQEHPEWRQFLILAALNRADAIERLRAIPNVRIPDAPPAPPPQAGLSPDMPTPPALPAPIAAPVTIAPPPVATPAPIIKTEATPTPSKSTVAALPVQGVDKIDKQITGAIGAADAGTLRVSSGDSALPEMLVMMPRERPPMRQRLGRHRPHASKLRRQPHRTARAPVRAQRVKPAKMAQKKPATNDDARGFDLFSAIFNASPSATTQYEKSRR